VPATVANVNPDAARGVARRPMLGSYAYAGAYASDVMMVADLARRMRLPHCDVFSDKAFGLGWGVSEKIGRLIRLAPLPLTSQDGRPK
jgi:hypothetical protein